MAKIIYIPLDERPCNYDFPCEIFKESAIEVIVPPSSIMGKKKKPADFDQLSKFLFQETTNAYGLVVSIDTLLYGGIVPSRIHCLDKAIISSRLDLFRKIKQFNPDLKIFAFQLIMRSPQCNSSDEEPSYYKTCGREIFLSGYYKNKQLLGILAEEDQANFEKLKIEDRHLNDFLSRRALNREFNLKTLDLLEEGIIDFLIVPQDDSSEYGYPAMDQEEIRRMIHQKHLMLKAYMYPGADEVGCTLVARMLSDQMGKKARIFVKYPSPTTPMIVPCLEDRYLDTTIKYQIIAAGGMLVPSLADADIVLIALSGATKMIPHPFEKNSRDLDVLCNLIESIEFAKWAADRGYPVAIADLIYLNGGSADVMRMIEQSNLTLKLASYSGWNTSSNSLGTTIAQAVNFFFQGPTVSHYEFLMKRYIEDVGYCGIVRGDVTKELGSLGMNYYDVHEKQGIASRMVQTRLLQFVSEYMPSAQKKFALGRVSLPWARMFEVAFDISWREKL